MLFCEHLFDYEARCKERFQATCRDVWERRTRVPQILEGPAWKRIATAFEVSNSGNPGGYLEPRLWRESRKPSFGHAPLPHRNGLPRCDGNSSERRVPDLVLSTPRESCFTGVVSILPRE
jgi:hypothetical protein